MDTQKPVMISYTSLLQNDLTPLHESIQAAFGSSPTALGLIVVNDLPEEFTKLRQDALRAAAIFAQDVPEATREKYTDADSFYSFGWSHGKEIMNGKPDTYKGSYYANPVVDVPTVDEQHRKEHPSYLRHNIWPSQDDCPGYEQAFKALAKFLTDAGKRVAKACDNLVATSSQVASIESLIANSQCSKARLLHYYPPPDQVIRLDEREQSAPMEEAKDSWCGDHLDHSLLTALCPAMYLFHPYKNTLDSSPEIDTSLEPLIVPSPTPTSGLFIRTRAGKTVKATLPPNALAFQTGEALEVLTGGKLKATPHYVAAGTDGEILPNVLQIIRDRVKEGKGWAEVRAGTISRETMAVFLQPDVDDKLTPEETFGEFTTRILKSHYDGES